MTNEKTANEPLVDFDDPDDIEPAPETARSLDSAVLAAAMAAAGDRPTLAPAPSYAMLKDSCRIASAAKIDDEALLEDEDARSVAKK